MGQSLNDEGFMYKTSKYDAFVYFAWLTRTFPVGHFMMFGKIFSFWTSNSLLKFKLFMYSHVEPKS